MLCLKNIERKLLNIAIFNEAIKELSLKYSMQDIDIINLFIETSEEIFNSKMQLYCKEDNVYLVKIENQNTHKKINLNTNTLKKISLAFEVRLKERSYIFFLFIIPMFHKRELLRINVFHLKIPHLKSLLFFLLL